VRITRAGLPLIVGELRGQRLLLGFWNRTVSDGIGRIFVIVGKILPVQVLLVVVVARVCGCDRQLFAFQQTLKRSHFNGQQLNPAAACQPPGQGNRSETQSDESADGEVDRIKHPPHLAVAALGYHHPVPGIGPFSSKILEETKGRQPIIERHPCKQGGTGCLVDPPQDPDGVLTLPTVARVHQPIGDIPRGRKDQKTFGIEVQSPH
jgi:hypothetical protein